MASAGTVTVDFAAETAKFTAELKKVNASLNKLEGNFKSVEKVASFALKALSTGALVAFAKQAFDAADATATAAERAGIAVESFSRLQFAASQADVEMGALTTGLQRFQIAISNAAAGSRTAQATLAEFGLQVEKLSKLQIEQQLAEVADAFAKISDPADRTRLAVELFGKSAGPQLVPLLAQGRAGIAEVTKAADDLGITMSSTTAAGIDQADAAIKTFLATLQGAAQKSIGTISVALLGPPNEIVALEKQIESLKQQRDEILFSDEQGVGVGFDIYRKRVEEINALLPQLESRLKSIQQIQAGIDLSGGPVRRTLGSSAVVSEIDIAAIQAMKIEVDELGAAYLRLAQATAEVRGQRSTEALELSTAGLIEAQRQVEDEITRDLEFQLQARSQLQSFYRQQELDAETEAADAIAQLKAGAYSSGIQALRAFAGQSEKTAKALVLIEQGRALATAAMNTYEAVTLQLRSGDPYTAFARAAAAGAYGGLQVAAIAATAYGQIKQISAAGGAPIGSPVNPINMTTVPDDEERAESQRAVQVVFAGPVFTNDQTKRFIAESIREAVDDQDVIIIGSGSRQAQELVGA